MALLALSSNKASFNTLREKCLNIEFFLARIFLYLDWIQENTDQKKLRVWTLLTQCQSIQSSVSKWKIDYLKQSLRKKESVFGVILLRIFLGFSCIRTVSVRMRENPVKMRSRAIWTSFTPWVVLCNIFKTLRRDVQGIGKIMLDCLLFCYYSLNFVENKSSLM